MLGFFVSDGQGALFVKTAPWTPAKTFGYMNTAKLAEDK
jgi:hypothetical protein